ncbi:Zinc finger MYM-type protein 1-like [Heracleum sosnowskyi]|uniref:Zinc finger MYM-type protein 1-like n=1 Tax=Heracleum sosnowskyi TaxID=360622 RepID=A0AAD8J3T1_9APIA|nr:Zinc finger MYM-type protein 1-like [Heracleum sosnowskyi]
MHDCLGFFSLTFRDLRNGMDNGLPLDVTSILLRQGLPFRGHDESSTSVNRGNFLEFLEWYSIRNKEISKVVTQNAPGNNQMTSPLIQKEMANACATETTLAILKDIGDSLFTILVDESRDISVKEQMAVVLRYVNKSGEVIERFLALVHMQQTHLHQRFTATELYNSVLVYIPLSLQQIGLNFLMPASS